MNKCGTIIEQVASNKSCLLLNIRMQNTITLQLFTEITKTESIYKSVKNAKLEGLVLETSGLIKVGEEP